MLKRGPENRAGWRVVAPALLVAVCAVAATAHGLFEVAVASNVPWPIAALYPVVTDGLALVAYAATHRLRGWSAGYAWLVTILAAGLSGLAQAAYLASEPLVASQEIRFGVGAWPAVAAAIVAHLLYLLARPAPRLPKLTSPVLAAPPAMVEAPTPPASITVGEPGPFQRQRVVADLVAEMDTAPVPTTAPSAKPAALRKLPGSAVAVKAPAPPSSQPAEDDLVAQARELLAAGAGRPQLVEKLGVTDYRAKQLQKALKP